METLTSALRRELRARAHHLHPVVAIGQHGLTPSVLHEIDVALTAHELVKLRVFSGERPEREALLGRICDQLSCAPVQHLGKLLILWRKREEEPPVAAAPAKRPARPGKSAKPQGRQAAGGRPATPGRPPRGNARVESAAEGRHPRGTGAATPPPGNRRRRNAAADAPAGVPRAAAPRRRRAR
ncbi:MAG TPA: YhbY family RNA-binding protein [Casimicrobiaceae bacterium]|nr:YhbY family RNA-binding protein [Casimicrobiaceae bacterium]